MQTVDTPKVLRDNQQLKTGQTENVGAMNDLDESILRPCVGIIVSDAINSRLVEAASIHLELEPRLLQEENLASEDLSQFDLLVADELAARRIRALWSETKDHNEVVNPALIAVVPRGGSPRPCELGEPQFDGVLTLPQEPAPIVAQLGLILYAHRAFARKYQTAMEELHLNRRIFRSVTSGISVSNASLPDLPLVYVNPAFEAITGYSLEEVQGKNCRFLQNDDGDQPGLTLIREAIKARREVIATIKNYRKDGTAFWNELSLSPICNREGELTHFVGIQQDVTARVEFEAALRESEKLAAVGRLAASIAHEINNPLESVMNLLYLAREANTDDVRSEYLGLADKELQRVAQITSQSLRFYRQSTKPHAVRCHDLIQAVLDVYESRAKNLEIQIDIRERMSESIVCLESEIRQVLSNLVRNAMDAMHGRGRLLVRSRESTEWRAGRGGAMITVADTGTGISKETMDRLYTAFFTTKGMSGTGLGLWVSAEIVKRHNGRLRVRSSQKAGRSWTVFQLFLPYQGPVE
jgi:two-component system sporulation sensor kinase C